MYQDLIRRIKERTRQNIIMRGGFLIFQLIIVFAVLHSKLNVAMLLSAVLAAYALWSLKSDLFVRPKLRRMEKAAGLESEAEMNRALEHCTAVNEFIYVSDQYVLNYVTYHAYKVSEINEVSKADRVGENGIEGAEILIRYRGKKKDRIGFDRTNMHLTSQILGMLTGHLQRTP